MADDETSKSSGFFRSWKPWAIVLIPSLVGGIFAIGPTVYQEYTKPRSLLSFTQISGPTISAPNGLRQISLIRIENTGRTPLTNVALEVESADGEIESSALSPTPGLRPISQTSPTRFSAAMERMLPTETLSASVMTISKSPQAALKLGVRSNEILGSQAVPPQDNKVKTEILSAILAVAGAMIASISIMFVAISRRRKIFATRLLGLPSGFERSDIVTYICALSGVIPLSEELLFRSHEVSYRRAGDLFLFTGMKKDAETKAKCAIGLRAMLSAVNRMNDTSAILIRSNLAILGHELTDEQYRALRSNAAVIGEDLLAARSHIFDMFQPNDRAAKQLA